MKRFTFSKFCNKLLFSLLLFSFINHLYGTDCTADFSYGALNGTLPHSVIFTPSTSNFSASTEWRINGVLVSTSFTLNQSFTSDEIYEVCLRVYYSGCDVTLCKEIPINYDCPDCEVAPNHDFDYIFNPSPPGSLGSSNNFDMDVCEWYQATSTPYYCAYSSNNYIGLWNTQNTQEKVSTKEAIVGLNVNQEYVLTFQYSVQRYYENGPFRIYEGGPNGIDVKFGPYTLVTVPGVLPYNIP